MPTMKHPDLPDGQEITVGESRARVMRRSGWEEVPARPAAKRATATASRTPASRSGTDSTAGADAGGKEKPPAAGEKPKE